MDMPWGPNDSFARRSPARSRPDSRPPLKRKHSSSGEHALWIGNIPLQANILNLRDHFYQVAGSDLVSITYNPEARYAFANFSTKASRLKVIELAASTLFHEKRLDCRIRSESGRRSIKVSYGHDNHGGRKISIHQPVELEKKIEELSRFPEADPSQLGKDKYFIIKSFSIEAMHHSLQMNQWHVPCRHVYRINNAVQTARKVYLIFSVNGSGQFFGYALLTSAIVCDEMDNPTNDRELHFPLSAEDENPAQNAIRNIAPASSGQTPSTTVRSRSPSDASSQPFPLTPSKSLPAPLLNPGIIQYKPSRRQIVWEASSCDHRDSAASDSESSSASRSLPSLQDGVARRSASSSDTSPILKRNPSFCGKNSPPTSTRSPSPTGIRDEGLSNSDDDTTVMRTLRQFGHPCRIKWLAADSLSFDEVCGIRNKWNDNKPIHVARNATPVHPDAATALLDVWRSSAARKRMERLREASARAWGNIWH
ncbi:hypothetical protein AYL99_02109 [Fonsecaea erecta]|uniref:YTH domain-containing protein n=1 Tax=Fonsecaea erecta TaxID=1367422 RepID=A0A178ZT36_9EURO|nr:hypothetical protein AYL99_02109 [Fonsecaea erecta]OAP62882.1 hypothetical protein AYL99_02109 [Fonsecaea erecta]